MKIGFQVNLETVSVKELQSLWRPYLILMRIMGLTFTNDPPWNPLKFYSLLVVSGSWGVLAFHLYVFIAPLFNENSFNVNHETMTLLSMACYITQLSLKCLAVFLAFHGQHCMKQFFQMWSTLKLPSESAKRLEAAISTAAKFGIAVVVIVFILSEIVEGISFVVVAGHFPPVFLLYVWIAFLDCVLTVFCWLLLTTLTALFHTVNECFLRNNLDNRMPFEELCSMFYTAVDMVSAADISLKIMFGGQVLSNLLQCCINTYILVFDQPDGAVNLAITIYWDILTFCQFWFVFWGAANVNAEAHRLLNNIHQLPAKNIRSSEMVQVLVLQNCLSNNSIGFSMFGVQIITKGALPVIMSGYITYVFLMAQFHLGNTSPHCDCHCFRNISDNLHS